jgi:hypothetical protein
MTARTIIIIQLEEIFTNTKVYSTQLIKSVLTYSANSLTYSASSIDKFNALDLRTDSQEVKFHNLKLINTD